MRHIQLHCLRIMNHCPPPNAHKKTCSNYNLEITISLHNDTHYATCTHTHTLTMKPKQDDEGFHAHLWQTHHVEDDDNQSCDTVQLREPCTSVVLDLLAHRNRFVHKSCRKDAWKKEAQNIVPRHEGHSYAHTLQIFPPKSEMKFAVRTRTSARSR